jgi:hypothetical protein
MTANTAVETRATEVRSCGIAGVDVLYAAPQAHGIVNVALHQEHCRGIIFIFSYGRKYLYHV